MQVAPQIRNVPDEVRNALAERARSLGQSLQAFRLSVLQEEARRSRNLALLERFADRRGEELMGNRVQPGGDAA